MSVYTVPAYLREHGYVTVPARVTEDLGWQDLALCAETDPEAFFVEKGGSTREGKQVCRGCDVRELCLQYALETGQAFGIWGGFSERQRRPIALQVVAGKPVADIIAEDNARQQRRQKRTAELAAASARRQSERQRLKHAATRDAASPSDQQPQGQAAA